jgi:hypothetical protein
MDHSVNYEARESDAGKELPNQRIQSPFKGQSPGQPATDDGDCVTPVQQRVAFAWAHVTLMQRCLAGVTQCTLHPKHGVHDDISKSNSLLAPASQLVLGLRKHRPVFVHSVKNHVSQGDGIAEQHPTREKP